MRWSGALHARGALLIHAAGMCLLQLDSLMPGLQFLRHDLPWQQPDGVVRILLQGGRSHQSGVRRRRLQDSSRGQRPFSPLWRRVCQRRWRQVGRFHVGAWRREGAVLLAGPGAYGAGQPLLLCSKMEAVRRRAELWYLSGSVPAWGADVRGGRVLRAAVLRAGQGRTKGRVLWGTHHEVSHTASLGQPATPSTALWAPVILVSRWLRKSVKSHRTIVRDPVSLAPPVCVWRASVSYFSSIFDLYTSEACT